MHVVGDVAAGDRREQHQQSRPHDRVDRVLERGPHAAALERRQPARRRPAGRGHLAANRERVVVARREQRGRPGHRLGHEPAGEPGREPVADRGVDLGLDQQRLVGGPDAHHRAGRVHQPLGDLDDDPEPPEQLEHLGFERGVDARARRA